MGLQQAVGSHKSRQWEPAASQTLKADSDPTAATAPAESPSRTPLISAPTSEAAAASAHLHLLMRPQPGHEHLLCKTVPTTDDMYPGQASGLA